jgi:hypothetical protein
MQGALRKRNFTKDIHADDGQTREQRRDVFGWPTEDPAKMESVVWESDGDTQRRKIVGMDYGSVSRAPRRCEANI